MLIDNQIRLFRLPLVRNVFEREAERAAKIFREDTGAIESALSGWAALNNCPDTILPQIVEMSEVVCFPKGYRFIKYKGEGDDVFILIKGEALVKTPDGKLPVREAVISVGEKRAIDRHSHRTAHVYAKTEVIALKLKGSNFRTLREQCRTFEQNIDRDIRNRHTQAGLPKRKSSQWYIVLCALGLAVAFGLLSANQTKDLILGLVTGLAVFGLTFFFMKRFVVKAIFTVVAGLLFAFQFSATLGSDGQPVIDVVIGQPSNIGLFLAVLLAAVALVLDFMSTT